MPFYFNTHWDHIGEEARQQSASLMRQRILQIAGGAPAIATGDFNCADNSKAYHLFTGPREDAAGKLHLIDSYRELHPQRAPADFTFHGFTGTNSKIARIDWILHTADFRSLSCEIDHTNEQGRYPSDHFPVTAILEPTQPPPATGPTSLP